MLLTEFVLAQSNPKYACTCDNALLNQTDIRTVNNKETRLYLLTMVDSTNYQQFSKKWNGSVDVDYGLFDSDASANYENFKERRKEIFSNNEFDSAEVNFSESSEKYLPNIAYTSWISCIRDCTKRDTPDLYLTIDNESLGTIDFILELILPNGENRNVKITEATIEGGKVSSGKKFLTVGEEIRNRVPYRISVDRKSGEKLRLEIFTDFNGWNASIPTLEPQDYGRLLFEASNTGDLNTAKRLVEEYHAPLNYQNPDNANSLMTAIDKGHYNIVKYFLSLENNLVQSIINHQDFIGGNSLYYSTVSDNPNVEITKRLHELGASLQSCINAEWYSNGIYYKESPCAFAGRLLEGEKRKKNVNNQKVEEREKIYEYLKGVTDSDCCNFSNDPVGKKDACCDNVK